jgi:PAS domain-containing protein
MSHPNKTNAALQEELKELQHEFSYLNALKDADASKRKVLERELAQNLQEIATQNEDKEKRAAELITANLELIFQSKEKAKRVAELVLANVELIFQNKEKAKRAAELVIANKELAYQNEEKKKRATELMAALEKAKDFENKFRQITDNIDEVFWLRTENSMNYVSPSFEKIWGIPCQAIYDDPQLFTEIIHPEDKPLIQAILQSKEFKENKIFEY